jgi:hypothetical protein
MLSKKSIKISLIISIFLLMNNLYSLNNQSAFNEFISVRGDKLYEGDSQFRFISFNIPNLLSIEDNVPFTEKNAWRLPDLFEIEDALNSIKLMGGNVARTYVITVHRESDTPDIPRHVLSPGKFNEEAFKVLDQVLVSANRIGVRIIIPFVDNWKWMGGKPQYAKFRGKDAEEFWRDKQIKEDFKKTISFILNRVNSISGIPYKDDKAILAWELGNELQTAPVDWINEMARYIKSIDHNHLINDGIQKSELYDKIIESKYIDILSSHHYEKTPLEMLTHIKKNAAKAKGKKPYYIGEFGFISTSGIETILNFIQQEKSISGALIWSLRFHNRDGGFYWHSEPLGAGLYKAYHIPGFHSGNRYDEINLIKLLRVNAYKIQGMQLKEWEIPKAPNLLPIKDTAHISWQGAAGAAYYRLERSLNANGPWETVGNNISDASLAYEPLFNDRNAPLGNRYYYRVFAVNNSGESPPSNIVGPVLKSQQTLVDNMVNYGKIFNYKGKSALMTNNARDFKEDFQRISGDKGTEVIYYVPGKMKDCIINVFSKANSDVVKLLLSFDGLKYDNLAVNTTDYFSGEGDYQYWRPIQIKSDTISGNYRYLKISFIQTAQIGRVEINYGN